MKRNKIIAVLLSFVMSMTMLMPSIEVIADETPAPSETQKTESTENKEPKTTEKQEPKETKKSEPKETEAQEPKETEKQEPKETETQEPKRTEKQEPKETETQEPKDTEKQEPKETETQEPKGTEKSEPKETEKQEPEETEMSEPEESDNKEGYPQEITPNEDKESESETSEKRKAAYSYSGRFGDNLMWSFNENGTLTISGSGNMPNFWPYNLSTPWKEFNSSIKSIVILDGVTSIGTSSFSGCKELVKVSIPNSVRSINSEAFFNCSSLSDIDFSSEIITIGPRAFQNCSSLTCIEIPDSVTTIWENAFSGCSSLNKITIPDSVTTIKDNAFSDCKGLTNITYPKGLTTIGSGIFSNCTGLEKVTIPSGTTAIGAGSFKNCSRITNITIPDSVTTIGNGAFIDCSSISSISIPANVSELNGTFNGCTSLKSITIPNGVVTIGHGTFAECTNLKSITIPNSVTTIGDYAFYKCTSLSSVVMHEGLTSIGEYAFSNCSDLTSVIIPSSVTSIENKAFYTCSALKYVVVNKSLKSEYSFDLSNIEFHFYYDVTYTSNGCGVIKGKKKTYGTDVIDISIEPNSNYSIEKITWTSSGQTIELTQNDDGKFIMPDADGSVTIKAFFVVSGNCGDDLKWALSGDGALTISGSGEMFDWNSLTDVPWNEYRSNISSISFSDGVTSIGKHAFQSCTKLNKVMIPDSVTAIGMDAFKDCTDLNSIVLNKDTYNPNAFPNIPAKALHYYYDVIYDDYNESDFVAVSGKKRTYGTDVLELTITGKKHHVVEEVRLLFPNSSLSLTRKTNNTWECRMPDSNSAASVFISVKAACGENLTWDMDYLDGNPILVISGSGDMYNWTNADDAPWSEYKEDIIDIVFPDGLTSIGKYSFCSFKKLKSVKIPDNVSSIGYGAFWSCSKLNSVVLNRNAYNLKAFTLSSTISRIKFHYYYDVEYSNYGHGSVSGKARVYGSEEVKLNISREDNYGIQYMKIWCWNCDLDDESDEEPYEIVLAEISVDSYENCVIKMPDSERNVVVETFFTYNGAPNTCGSNLTWTLDDNGTLTISGSGDMANFIGGGYAILGSEQDDCPWKNYRDKIKAVVFVGEITSIGNASFEECKNLSSVTIPSPVKKIGEKAFDGCKSLTSITIPNSVTFIGEAAFGNCSGLTSLSIPNDVTTIGQYAFSGCTKLTQISIPEGITTIYNGTFMGCSSLTGVELPSRLTSIGECAFSDCTSLTSITIPISVTSIGYGAFSGCIGFTSISIPEGVTSINEYVFGGCSNLTSITLPDGITLIGEGAFSGCSKLTIINLPNSVTSIADGAFGECSSLKSFTIPQGITAIASDTFRECHSLSDIVIPDSVISIGECAFSNCTSLTSIIIPQSVTSINYGAFGGCVNLRSITIPNSVTSIEEDIFYGCINLTTVVVTGNVTAIRGRSFRDCTNLKDFKIPYSVTVIGDEAFAGCKGLTSINIPNNVESIGDEAFRECDKIEKVKLPDSNVTLGEKSFAENTKLNSVILNKSSYNKEAFTGCAENIYHYYYDVNYSNDGHGTVTGNQRSYGTDEMQFKVTPEPGYVIDKVTLKYAGKTVELTSDNNGGSTNGSMHLQNRAVFVRANSIWGLNKEDLSISYSYTMPDAENGAEIKATFKKIGYSVSVGETVNGTASVDMSTATVGDVVTVTTTPAKGYKVDTIKVNGTTNNGFTFIMPAGNVTVIVTFKKINYKVSLSDTTNGSASVDKTTAVIDDVVKVSYTPDQGYELDEIKVNDKAITGQEFTMDAGDATVTVTFKKIQYTISVNAADNGSATISRATAGIGDEVTVIVAPNKGYYLTAIKVNGTNIEGTTFTMPAENVTVELEFSEQLSNTLTVRGGKTAKVKYRKLRKKTQTVSRSKVMTVSNANGSVRYSLVSVKRGKSKKYKKYFKVNATTGTVTVKKKLRKGTYTITCRVTAAGDVEHKAITKTVKFKIKVK